MNSFRVLVLAVFLQVAVLAHAGAEELSSPEIPTVVAPEPPPVEAPEAPSVGAPDAPSVGAPGVPEVEAPPLPEIETSDQVASIQLPVLEAPTLEPLVAPELEAITTAPLTAPSITEAQLPPTAVPEVGFKAELVAPDSVVVEVPAVNSEDLNAPLSLEDLRSLVAPQENAAPAQIVVPQASEGLVIRPWWLVMGLILGLIVGFAFAAFAAKDDDESVDMNVKVAKLSPVRAA